jgi:hypothetical protein
MAYYWVNYNFLIIIKASLEDYPFDRLPNYFSSSAMQMAGTGNLWPTF